MRFREKEPFLKLGGRILHRVPQPVLLRAFDGRQAELGPEHPHTIESLKELATLCESWPKADEAAQWRAKLLPKEDAEQ
jgi:hypothetical protein